MPAGQRKETYTAGYSKAATTAMSLRSAERAAGFFLSHLKKGTSVLDCGCGPGTITQGLATAVAPGKAVGIDLSEAQVAIARDGALGNGVKNVEFRVGDVYEIPFPDGSFNAVFSHTVLEHLKRPDDAISEMLRVLKPGGVLGARSSNVSSYIFSPPSKYMSRWFECLRDKGKKNGGDLDFGIVQSGLFRRAGLQRVTTTTSTFHLSGADWQKILSAPTKAVQEFLRSNGVPEEEVRPMLAGNRRWSRNPDAFGSAINTETVGWKPKR